MTDCQTDDTLILQLDGSKTWKTCVPKPDGSAHLSDSDKAALFAAQRNDVSGCTSFDESVLSQFECSTFVLTAGDVLYLPRGIVHVAHSGDHGSTHLTVSLDQKGLTWLDLLRQVMLKEGMSESMWDELIKTVSSDPNFVRLHKRVPAALCRGDRECLQAGTPCYNEIASEGHGLLRSIAKQSAMDVSMFVASTALQVAIDSPGLKMGLQNAVEAFVARGQVGCLFMSETIHP